MRDDDLLLTIFLIMLPLSFLSIGGGASIIAPLQNQTVNVHQWMTSREFIDIFAISRAAPGPGSILVTLIGWKVAGWWGAIVATLGIFVPSSVLCYGVSMVWTRYRGTIIHTAFERGLAPIGIGLLMSGAITVLRTAETGWTGLVIAALSTGVLVWKSIHPLLVLAAGGAIYAGYGALVGH
jgi:chromate transporter